MIEPIDDDFESEKYESRFEELESRVDELTESTASLASSAVSGGYCVGAALATVLSWSANHTVGWAAIHGFLSWLYVIYYAARHWDELKLF